MADPVSGAMAITKVASTGFSIVKVANTLKEKYRNYLEKKETDWWQAIIQNWQARNPHETEEEIEQRLHDLGKRDNALKAIMQSYRSLMESLDDSVLAPLAAITAEYLALDKLPDRFYRGTCRMLADLSFEELTSLREMIGGAVKILDSLENSHGSVKEIGIGQDSETKKLKIDGVSANDKPTNSEIMPMINHYVRLIQLLNGYGLAQNQQVWGGQKTRINAQDLRKLNDVLNKG